jgi:glucose-1-phosphate cytidylyltransferase
MAINVNGGEIMGWCSATEIFDQEIKSKTIVVILCGGQGTRIRDLTNGEIPKPLIKIGGKPIVMHIIDHYMNYGFHKFILALGHQWEQFDELNNYVQEHINQYKQLFMSLTFTGEETETAGRIYRLKEFIQNYDYVMITYGDGISNVHLDQLLQIHLAYNRTGAITIVPKQEQFGLIELQDNSDIIESFKEKPASNKFINGGFMIFDRSKLFEYMKYLFKQGITLSDDDPETIVYEQMSFEKIILNDLASKKQLVANKHYGYWHCMDTYKDYLELEADFKEGKF